MHRLIVYRGFEIHVELTPAAEDTFNVTFQIKGGTNLEVLGVRGGRVPLRNGPFTERWAYLVGEIAGQAAHYVEGYPLEKIDLPVQRTMTFAEPGSGNKVGMQMFCWTRRGSA
jgi:hypothetical protein